MAITWWSISDVTLRELLRRVESQRLTADEAYALLNEHCEIEEVAQNARTPDSPS